MLDCKQSELGTGRGSYAIILLVLPLGSLTIAKFKGVSVHCFVVALFQLCTYTTNILSIYIFYILNFFEHNRITSGNKTVTGV